MKRHFLESLILTFCISTVGLCLDEGYHQPGEHGRIVEANRVKCLNRTFKEGEVLLNLMPADYPFQVEVYELSSSGAIQTRYTVEQGFTCTFTEKYGLIVPEMGQPNPTRLKRLDGQGYAKEQQDGSFRLGSFAIKNLVPVGGNSSYLTAPWMTMGDELSRNLTQQQRERLPEQFREMQPTRRNLVPHKPTPEELQKIVEAKKSERQRQLDGIASSLERLQDNISEDAEAKEISKGIQFGVELLQKNIEDESIFERFLKDVTSKLQKLTQIVHIAMKSAVIGEPTSSVYSVDNHAEMRAVNNESKERARSMISASESLEQVRLSRPNADPSGKESDEEEDSVEAEETLTTCYVFQNPLKHGIIESLRGTSREFSSYAGINITRDQLENFVSFLESAEKDARVLEGINVPDLWYYYRPGKGSHTKVKLGLGVKPIIMSQQGGLNLTPEQMRDLREVLVQKGLLDHDSQIPNQ